MNMVFAEQEGFARCNEGRGMQKYTCCNIIEMPFVAVFVFRLSSFPWFVETPLLLHLLRV